MKPLNPRFKTILKIALFILALIVLLVISWVAYINLRGDDEMRFIHAMQPLFQIVRILPLQFLALMHLLAPTSSVTVGL